MICACPHQSTTCTQAAAESCLPTDYTATIVAVLSVVLLPATWNVLARANHHYRWLNKLWTLALGGGPEACNVKLAAAYTFAVAIFVASGDRDVRFVHALYSAPVAGSFGGALLGLPTVHLPMVGLTLDPDALLGYGIVVFGSIFVVGAFARLGVAGTYLGDYCGVLLPHRVTGFPFNVLDSPMYTGASINFLGLAVANKSPLGVFLAVWVLLVYRVSCVFEDSFTGKIYAEAAEKKL